MATEQYSIGYEEGFQNGWNAAVDSLPAQRKPLTDGRISWLWSDAHNDTTDRMPFQVFARAIEAHHNIKEKTHEQRSDTEGH